jgi:hypothetical protein
MDLYSDTTKCRKANICYIPHNMYLVNQSITSIYLLYSVKHKPNSENHILNIYHKLIIIKSQYYIYLFKSFLKLNT